MDLDEQAVKEITFQHYKEELNLYLKGLKCLEQFIIIKADKSKLFNFKETQNNEKVAISICVMKIYKTLKVMYDTLIKGYYSETISLLRNIVELQVLIKYFEKKPEKANLWLQNKFEPKYGNMCDELGFEKTGRTAHYKMLCEHTHPNFKGNLFFNWNIEKMKETTELNFTIEFTNSFNEFIFIGITSHIFVLLRDILVKQFRTINLSKETLEEFYKIMVIEKDHPFKINLDIMNEFRKESEKINEKLFQRMLQIATEKGADISEFK